MTTCPFCKQPDALVPQVISKSDGEVYYKACRLCGGQFANEDDVAKTNQAGQDMLAGALINQWSE